MTKDEQNAIAEALRAALISPAVQDRNGESANIVDAVDNVARALWAIAKALDRKGG